jgi:hypothetical protein
MDNSSDNTNTMSNILPSLFNQTNIIILIWFLAIYYVIYFLLAIFYGSQSNSGIIASRLFDFIIFISLLIILLSTFLFSTYDQNVKTIGSAMSSIKEYLQDPISLFSITLFIIVLYAAVYLIGLPMGVDNKPTSIKILEGGAWICFVIVLIENVFKFVFGLDFIDMFSNWIGKIWNQLPVNPSHTSQSNVDASGNPIQPDEVFNIAGNSYTYEDAQAICKSYGASLATYDQIEDAYNKGGEWCNYGWSDKQMAFFPTQKSTWLKLQEDPETKNNCGRPGINGGYIENPYVKFGVNCFGKKPKPSDNDLAYMSASQEKIKPTTPEQTLLDKKVQFWKENASQMLHLSGFNKSQWSEYMQQQQQPQPQTKSPTDYQLQITTSSS